MHLLCQDCWAINEGKLFSEAVTWLFKDCAMRSPAPVCVCVRETEQWHASFFFSLSRTRCLGVCVHKVCAQTL